MNERNGPFAKRILFVSVGLVAIGAVALSASLVGSTAAAAEVKKKRKAAEVKSTATPARTLTANVSSSNRDLRIQKQATELPKSQVVVTPNPEKSLAAVKPPKSNSFYESANTKEAEYERLVDQEIKALYALSQTNRKSANRGEIWLRLGEQYVEKSRLVEMRMQAEYDRRVKEFTEKRSTVRPKLDQSLSHEYNQKAVQLYEWFVHDFPQDSKLDQALFFLGYNHFELGNTREGERRYLELVQRYPNSSFVVESHFALGEFYFENEDWRRALDSYLKVIAAKRARLQAFALYKSAWCYYRLGRTQAGLQALERVIRLAKAGERDESGFGQRAVNKIRLGNEALKDYVPFYAEVGVATAAQAEFEKLTGDPKQTLQMLERLAFIYADQGNRASATALFRQLIAMNPNGERAADYQYQIVLIYTTTEPREFRRELDAWLVAFGPQSKWAKQNSSNQKLVGDVARLQETTLRNYVLQQHQIAQNSRTEYSQRAADAAYGIYFKYFPESSDGVEMRFFHAELLFDMEKYEDAGAEYNWVAKNDSQGTYRERAIINALLALEKDLPDPKVIDAKRGNSTSEIAFEPAVTRFEQAALVYVKAYPNAERTPDIERRLGVLYYSYNHFDQATSMFEHILREHPKSPNAVIAGNLMLDIYKLRNDMVGFTEKGKELLANPDVANSAFGQQVRAMLEKAGYLRAEKISESGEHARAAKEFEAFAASYKQSDLAAAARYKAAVSYEKAGDARSASRMYGLLLATPSSDAKIKEIQNDSRNNLARLQQQTGQLDQAANQYYEYAEANPKDVKATNGYFNAGVLWEALGEGTLATTAYQKYYARSKNADRVEVLFSQAEIWRKKRSNAKALALYQQYLNEGPRDEAHAIRASFEIAKIQSGLGQAAAAEKAYLRTLTLHDKSRSKESTAGVAAEARFTLAQKTLREISDVRFTTNDRQQAAAAKQILLLKDRYIKEMKEVIRFDNAPFIVAALASTGKMFDSIAEAFQKIPAPKGFSSQEAARYKELIQQQVKSLRDEAKSSYQSALEKSSELEAYTEWTQIAQRGLMAYDSKNADSVELTSESRALDWMGM